MSSLRKTNSKNCGHYCADDMLNIKHLDLDKILLHEKPYQRNFINSGPYKTQHGERPSAISFDKVYEYIEKYSRDIYLSLFYQNI